MVLPLRIIRVYHMNMSSYDFKRCACGLTHKHEMVQFRPVVTKLLKVASTPSKMKILLLLERSPHCVCDLITHTKLSQTLISHHLSDLTEVDLVRSEKNGAFVDYSLTDKGRKLMSAIQKLIL